MEAQLLDWLNLLLRWTHVMAAILWVGDSFLFMWMDKSLAKVTREREGDVAGELWMVHSGGFYEVVKRRSLAQHELPPKLHWFKWQSYSTWLSGVALFAVVYWLGGHAYLLERGIGLSAGAAVAISAGLLVAAWLVYDLVWMSPLVRRTGLAEGVSFALLCATAWGLTQLFGGRAAYLQMGAMLGTVMAGNVWRRIIPGQDRMIADTLAGRPVDTSPGVRAKQRSTHNHYLTFPVLFLMLSTHFPATYGHAHAWIVLVLFVIFGAAVKYAMNFGPSKNLGVTLAGITALATLLAMTLQAPGGPAARSAVSATVPFEQARAIVERRCTTCHAAQPTNPGFPQAPAGVKLDTPDDLRAHAARVLVRAVSTKTMPLGNLTGMTDAERDTLGAWVLQGAKRD